MNLNLPESVREVLRLVFGTDTPPPPPPQDEPVPLRRDHLPPVAEDTNLGAALSGIEAAELLHTDITLYGEPK